MPKKLLGQLLTIITIAVSLGIFAQQTLLFAAPPIPIPENIRTKIDPRLLHALSAEDARPQAVIIRMKTPAALPARLNLPDDVVARRSIIRQTLQTLAESSQQGVRNVLAQAEAAGQASDIRPFWILNAVAATAGRDTILTLAARDDVAFIRPDEIISLPPFSTDETGRTGTAPEWGVAKISADAVWQSLGIDGSGVVVANVDTGVDFAHPALKSRYRGYQSETLPPVNTGNWFDATGAGATYPVDTNGHGTHTMGTMVGQNGIGVAPGARWIAVRAFDQNGGAQESWLHAAFQWLLAPDGNPALAPDIINNSWSNSNGSTSAFADDVSNLLAAGIISVFASGNSGSEPGSVGAPGSYSNALAVGATDSDDVIAYFSGRGPSPWGHIKPEVSAPGVKVVSSLPGGTYAAYSGTSMATPHVAGTLALMKQAAPTLSFTAAVQILTATAQSAGTPIPNNDYGWGRIDALAAVQLAMNAGTVGGRVTDTVTGAPVWFADVTFTPRTAGLTATTATDANGDFQRGLLAGDYTVSVAAFGYADASRPNVAVVTGTVITENFALSPLPTGIIAGQVTDADSGSPLTATITVDNTPISVTVNGGYALNLPAGSYSVTVTAWGHRVGHATGISVSVGQTTRRDFALPSAPTILLVDSGAWYNDSEIDFYRQALDALNYPYHLRRIVNLPADVPLSSTLRNYDVVLWSSPLDSPGYVGANNAVTDYLLSGGNFLVSGQDVAFFDGGGSLFFFAPYFLDLLRANFLYETDVTTVTGITGGIFDGLSLDIAGGDGADNQRTPDVIALTTEDYGSPQLVYPDGATAGQTVGRCLPYRAALLPFGVEGVNTAADRAAVLGRALDWFVSPRVAVGLDVSPAVETRVGDAGETVTHTFRLFNPADGGITDTLTIAPGSHQWNTNLLTTSVQLAPCQIAWVDFTVDVPANAPANARDTITLTVQSTTYPTLTAYITRTTKSPAPLLLVDDDRWYDFEGAFTQSLTAAGFTFDVWRVQGQQSPAQGTPPLAILNRYPQVVWFTGYDWFDPLKPEEEATLKAYLDGGGRLAFSSQEYLYQLPDHLPSDFARTYFGVDEHSEILTSTRITGVAGSPIGDGLGPYPLDFPPGYQNWTDSITPTAAARPMFLGDSGLPNSATNFGTVTGTWHTAFFAFGPELIPEPQRTDVLRRTVGWLSWLGQSTVTADKTAAPAGDTITYTAVLRNDGLSAVETVFTATFPAPLTLVPGSATGGATEASGQVIWRGIITPGQPVSLTYRALVDAPLPYGTPARQISWITLPADNITFDRTPMVGINTADWAKTTLTANRSRAAIGDILTYTLRLENSGFASAPMVTVTGNIPSHLRPLAAQNGGDIITTANTARVEWRTPVTQFAAVTLSLQTQVISVPYPFTFPLTLAMDDGYTADNRWAVEVWVEPYQTYMPLIFK